MQQDIGKLLLAFARPRFKDEMKAARQRLARRHSGANAFILSSII